MNVTKTFYVLELSKPIDFQAPQSVQQLTKFDNDGELTINPSTSQSGSVLVVGTSSNVENLDMSLRRAGRFDKEIALGN